MVKPLRLVILDEDMERAKALAVCLSSEGVVAYAAVDPDEVCRLVSLLDHDVLLIDVDRLIRIPNYPLQAFRQIKPDLKIVGISRGRRGDTGLLLELLGLDAYIHEPLTPEALIISLPEVADRYLMVSLGKTTNPDSATSRRQELQSDCVGLAQVQRASPARL